MDPITLGLIFGGIKIAQKIRNGSQVKCRMCEEAISGDVSTTACCKNKLCPSCTQKWRRASHKNCVYCNAHQD